MVSAYKEDDCSWGSVIRDKVKPFQGKLKISGIASGSIISA